MKPIFKKIRNFFILTKWSPEDKVIGTFLILLFLVVLVRTAWLSDDAYITFRTVDNFVHGHGLTWNVTERVQSYSHPLWMLLMSFFVFFTRSVYFTGIFLSVSLATLAVYIGLYRQHKSLRYVLFGFLILISSKSFIEYSTSGMENALLYLLLAIFLYLYFCYHGRQRLLSLVFLFSLGMLTRLDSFLLFIPIITTEFYLDKTPIKKRLMTCLWALSPFIAWEIFSLVYYGYLVPNTFFAKTNTNVLHIWYLKQGVKYFLATLAIDPIGIAIIFVVSVMILLAKMKRLYPIVISLALYMIYILIIGGDASVGQYFSIMIFVVAVCLPYILGKIQLTPIMYGSLLFLLGFSGFLSPTPVLLSEASYHYYGALDLLQVHDARGLYYTASTPLLARRNMKITDAEAFNGLFLRNNKQKVTVANKAGYLGYYAGQDAYIINTLAYSDPLLSRIKADDDVDWLAGQAKRTVPCGYQASVETEENKICDPDLAQYYQKIKIITQDKLFSVQRFKTIIKMNIGGYHHFVESYQNRNSSRYEHKTIQQVLDERSGLSK